MFFDFTLLHRQNNGQFYIAWKAATLGVKAIPQKKILEVNIGNLCDELAKYITTNATSPKGRFSLRLSSFLLSGTIRLYRMQVVIQLDEIVKFLTTIKKPLEFVRPRVGHRGDSSEETDFSIFPTPPMRKPKVRGIKRTHPRQETQETPESELRALQRTLDEMAMAVEHPTPARHEEITIREEQPLQDQFPSDFGTLGETGVAPLDLEGMMDLPEVVREPPRAITTTEEKELLKRPSRKRKQQEVNKENRPPQESQVPSSGSEPQIPAGANLIVTSADVHVDADVSSPKKPRTPKKIRSETQRQTHLPADLDLIEEIESPRAAPPVRPSTVQPPTVLVEEIRSPQAAPPVVPVAPPEEEHFPFPPDQPTGNRPVQKKLMPKVKRQRLCRRDCRLEASGLNELNKITKKVSHDFDKDFNGQSLDADENSSQLPPVVTAPPQPPVEPIPQEVLPLPSRQETLEISPQRRGRSVRFSAETEQIERPILKGIDNTMNDTVAVAGQATVFPENAAVVEGSTPFSLQTPFLPSIEEEGIQLPACEETPKSRRPRSPRFEFIESPPVTADSHDRQKKILSVVKQDDKVYTIEEICPLPVNRFNIACTFADLLALSGRRYLALLSEEDSSDLKSILWGPRLKK